MGRIDGRGATRLRMISLLGVVGLGCTTALMNGCGSSSESAQDALVARQTALGNDLQSQLTTLDQQFEDCVNQAAATGTCVLSDDSTTHVRVILVGASPEDLAGSISAARARLAQIRQVIANVGNNVCNVIGPFASLNHPYFFYGGSVQGGVVAEGQVGMDVVYDMTNLQAAVFSYQGVGIGTLVGVEGSAYAGYGFGNKTGVIDAWSGRFCTASAGVGVKLPLPEGLGVSVGGSAFISPDESVYGGAVSISGSASNPLPIPVNAGASVTAADWSEWDAATQTLASNGFLINQTTKTDPSTGKQYIQYGSARDMALSLLWNAPEPMGAMAAAQVMALDLQKKTGLTIDQLCPAQAEAGVQVPPAIQAVGNACGAVNLDGGSSADGSSATDNGSGDAATGSSSSSDGGAPDVVIKDSCAGKADGLYCSELNNFSAYQCTGGTISGGQQCPSGQTCGGPNGPGTTIVCN